MNQDGKPGELTGRVAIVTGGSSGIGLEIGRLFARHGARVVLAGTTTAKAETAAETVRADGGTCAAIAADVSSFTDAAMIVGRTVEMFGTVDILVNSAGIWRPMVTGALVEAEVDRMIAVNLKGVIGMVDAVAPAMKRQRAGAIVNIASVAGLVAGPSFSIYCATKAAILMLTKVHALELAPFDVRVNAIAPGMTESPMTAELQHSPAMADQRLERQRITASNRPFTPAAEIAEAALMLAGDRIRGMHGSTMVIDEGRTAGIPDRR